MSYNPVPLRSLRITDPVLDVDTIHSVAIFEGASQVTCQNFNANSISNSTMDFSIVPPSSTIVDRMVNLQVPIRITFTGLAYTTDGAFTPNVTLLNANFDAPRNLALGKMIDVAKCTINGCSVSMNYSDIIDPITRYNNSNDFRSKLASTECVMPDCSNNYADLQGTNKNVLAGYGSGQFGEIQHRGGFSFKIVSNTAVAASVLGTVCTATVDFYQTTQLLLSPMFAGKHEYDNQGLYNVSTANFNFNFLTGSGFRGWSHDAISAVATSGIIKVTTQITSAVASFNNFSPAFSYPNNAIPTIQMKFYSPNILAPLRSDIPYTYGYNQIDKYVKNLGAITYNPQGQMYSGTSLALGFIPDWIMIFARPSNQTLQSRCDLTDTYLPVQAVQIQFGNSNTLLSSASQAALFSMDNKNGGDSNWQEFSGDAVNNGAFLGTAGAAQYCPGGHPVKLCFGRDIALPANMAVGLGGNFQLSISAQFANMNVGGYWNAIPMEMYVVISTPGTFTITSPSSAVNNLGIISAMDILTAREMPGINYRSLAQMEGSGFLESLGNFASRAHDWIKQNKIISTVGKALGPVIPGANVVGSVADSLGYGLQGGLAIGGAARRPAAKKSLANRR